MTSIAGEASSGISREEYIDKVANDILVKLPPEFDLDKIRKKFGLEISPTTVVLLQELERFNILNNKMNRSLVTLRKVITFDRISLKRTLWRRIFCFAGHFCAFMI